MREIILDGKTFAIAGDIARRNINPFTVKIGSGSTEFSDFSQASLREWHDLRGGIGLASELASETGRSYFAEGVDTSIERCIIAGPKINTAGTFGVTPVKIVDFSNGTYGIGHNLIAKWNTGTSAWDSKKADFANPIDALVVTDETSTYFVVSSATAAIYSTDGTTWNTLTGGKGYLSVLDNRLCGFYGGIMNYSPRGDIDGSWSTFKVSAYLGTIRRMFPGKLLNTGEPVLYLSTTEGLWAIDFWTQQIYKQEISFSPHTSAGYCGMYWNSYVFIATGAGIKKVTPGLVSDIGPDQDDGLPSGYQGYVSDMVGLSDWMIYAVNGGSSDRSSIFKRHGSLGGNHQIYTTSAVNNPITCIHHSPSSLYTNGRLWWGEGTSIKYCMFPDFTANPTEISTYEYTSPSGKLILPICRPLAVITKTALRVSAVTKNCSATKYITVYYKVDNASSWTSLGTFTSSPLPTALEFASGAGLEFRTIQFGLEFTTDSSTTTPELESLMFTFLPCPARIRGWQFPISVNGSNAETIISDLHTIQDKNTLVTFYPSGNSARASYKVKLTNISERENYSAINKEATLMVDVQEVFRG